MLQLKTLDLMLDQAGKEEQWQREMLNIMDHAWLDQEADV